MGSAGTCQRIVGTAWHRHRCNEVLKTEKQRAERLCARHLAGARRSAAALARRQAEADACRANRDAATALVDQLAEEGIAAVIEYDKGFAGLGSYTGRVVLDADAVGAILRRFRCRS